MLHVASSACLYCLSDRLCFYLSAGCLFYLLSCFFCPSVSQLPDALIALPNCQSVHLQPELPPCPCPSDGMLYDPSAALPLSICRHAAWSISCLSLYIWGHAARSFSCPASVNLPACWMIHLLHAFPVHLPASCMIHLLLRLSCPSVGLLHDQSPGLSLLSVCWPAAWSVSCPIFSVHLSAWCMLNLLPCLYCSSVGLLLDLTPTLPFLSICQPDACYISCLSCPSDSMLHDQSPAPPLLSACDSLLHDQSPALPFLSIC